MSALEVMSWLNRNQIQQLANQRRRWPRNCQFDSAQVDDQDLADLLVHKDTLYEADNVSAQHITYLFDGEGGAPRRMVSTNYDEDAIIWRDHAATSQNVVVLVYFTRLWGGNSTGSVRLSDQRWLKLVQNLALPPLALELLHDNNGGTGSRFSPCSSECVHGHDGPCAYHIWLKPANCARNKHFVYGRRNFHTGQNVIFCASAECDFLLEKINARLVRYPGSTLFHILYTHLSFCFYAIENGRWQVDDAIHQLETRTGHAHFVDTEAKQVASHELSITRDMAWARNMLHEYIKAALVLENLYVFAENQLHRYVKYDNSIDDDDTSEPHGAITVLSDALCTRISQIRAQIRQMEGLRTRIETQFNMVTAVVSARDSQISIAIAMAAQADNQLMKGIAVVTMIFLPATFFATFFSMVFFQPDQIDESLGESTDQYSFPASKWIWVYFVCTVPLTVLLLWSYGLRGLVRGMRQKPKLEQVE